MCVNLDDSRKSPRPGDCTICGHCGTILRFQDDMTTRLLTQEEFNAMPRGMQKAVAQFISATSAAKKQIKQ